MRYQIEVQINICFCSQQRFKLSVSEAPPETMEHFQRYCEENGMKLLPTSTSSLLNPITAHYNHVKLVITL